MCVKSLSKHCIFVMLRLVTKAFLVAASNLNMSKQPGVAGLVLLTGEPQRFPGITLNSYVF